MYVIVDADSDVGKVTIGPFDHKVEARAWLNASTTVTGGVIHFVFPPRVPDAREGK